MKIKVLPIAEIKIAKYNPRKDLKSTDPEYQRIKKSILEFDLVEPLVWNERSGNLVGGHQRIKILRELGYVEVEVSVVNLSDEKEKACNLALNKIAGEWDLPALKDILQELDTGAFDMDSTGFGKAEIEELMTQFHMSGVGLTDDDAMPEATESICKIGNLWQLGTHRLLCGDATKKDDVERLMGDEKVNMAFNDPPYGINLDTDWSDIKGSKKSPGWIRKRLAGGKYPKVIGDDKPFDFKGFSWLDCKEQFWCGADYYHYDLPDGGSWYVWDKRIDESVDKMIGSCFELIWSKKHHRKEFIRKKWAGVFGLAGEDSKKRIHPTQKPVELCSWFISRFSKLDDRIADFFGGSGATLIACQKLGRCCRMMEIDEHYCDIIIKRWQNYTGQKAELLDG